MNVGGHSQPHVAAFLHGFFQFYSFHAGACSTIGILHATKLLPMVGRSQGRLTLYLQGQPPEVSKRLESNQRQPPVVARLASMQFSKTVKSFGMSGCAINACVLALTVFTATKHHFSPKALP